MEPSKESEVIRTGSPEYRLGFQDGYQTATTDFAALLKENAQWKQIVDCAGFDQKGLLAVGAELDKREKEIAALSQRLAELQQGRAG